MKNICSKINFSYTFVLVIFLSLISGLFWEIFSLFTIIIVHELGHIIMSVKYKWRIKKVDITMCGGFITYDDVIDKPFKEELIVALSGIIMQSILFLLIYILFSKSIINSNTFLMFKKYHYSILIFNILPIIPLDGSKILNIFFNMFFSYKKSLILSNLVSVITIFISIFIFIALRLKLEYSYLMIICFIISKVLMSIYDTPFLFNKFLFERYTYPVNTLKSYYIKDGDINKMRRQKKNYFFIKNMYHSEKSTLSRKFGYYGVR